MRGSLAGMLLLVSVAAEGEMFVAVVEAGDEVFRWQENDPLPILIAGDDAAGGEEHFGWVAVASSFLGFFLFEPLHDSPRGWFLAGFDLIFGVESRL